MNIGKGKGANIVSLCTYAAVGNGINLKKARLTFIPIEKGADGNELVKILCRGRVVEMPRMECFGISGLRILPTVALDMRASFAFSCSS